VGHRFQIVIAPTRRSDTDNNARASRFGRLKAILAGFTLIVFALAALIAALVLGYIIAAILSLTFIVIIAVLLVKSVLRRHLPRE
jgi:hypothetical protein